MVMWRLNIEACPFKKPYEDDSSNLKKKHCLQNNCTNINLNTISKQLTRLERLDKKYDVYSNSSKLVDKKVKNPIFKPFQVSSQPRKKFNQTKMSFNKLLRTFRA